MVIAAPKDIIPSYPSGLTESPAPVQALQDMEIAGVVDGDIAGRTITVLESGSVRGTVGAETIVISGAVNGVVSARNIEVLATARVEGELRYDNLTVIPGAHMQARCTPAAA